LLSLDLLTMLTARLARVFFSMIMLTFDRIDCRSSTFQLARLCRA
jgi:hypothetical protein